MSTSDKIQGIIAQRQPLAQKLSEIGNHFSALHNSIQSLEQERFQQLECWRENAEVASNLQKIDVGGFQQTIQGQIIELRRLQGRLSRQTLNIGVIGRMGQGKSTLLKSLTGLQDDVIPALPGKACTAARSTIAHLQGAVTSAEILFHNEASFLQEVILPYYHKLGLTPTPFSFEDFASHELPDLPNGNNQTHINIYNRLRSDYHTHAKKYQEYLNRGSIQTQEQSQISNYVAQKYDQNYDLINHECLAVKHVKIQCSFPASEIGSIALVDVPGLGDFRLGDESLVIEALAQEVDFILFIRKPSKDRANFEQNDTQLYNLANKALNDLRDRSLFVLNIDSSGDNQESCRSLKRDIESNLVEMPVLDCIIADCSSQDEANSKVLHSVLENLQSQVTELDRNYVKRRIANLKVDIRNLAQQLQRVRMVLPEIDEDKISEEYDELFEKFWSQITNEMKSLQDRMREDRDLEDTNLKLQIDKVLQDCRQNSNLPSVEEINKLRNEKDSYTSAYSQYTVELRAGLSRRFLDIDEGLKQTIEEVKSQVVRVLIDKCHLGGLSEAKNSAFLAEVATQIPAKHDELKKGFDILAEFNLSYRGLIQHRIRSQLDNLVPDKTAGLPPEANSKVVLEMLTELYKEAIGNCEDALDGFLKEPSQASFAIVEEFIDRILRAKSSQKEWRQFLRKKRSQIWPNFDRLQTQVDAHKTWLSYLDAVDNQVEILENSLKQL